MGAESSKHWHLPEATGPDGEPLYLTLRHTPYTGYRKVELNGVEMYSDRKLINTGEVIPIQIGEDVAKIHITAPNKEHMWFEYRSPDMRAWVPAHEVRTQGDEQVVYYLLEMRCADATYLNWKRFSDFVNFDYQLRTSFASHHLLDNLPALPSRQVKLIMDHLNPDFVEERRLRLDEYVQALMKIPKVTQLPDFYQFVKTGATVKQEQHK